MVAFLATSMAVAMLVPLPLHTTRGASRCPAIVACDAANDAVAQGIVVRADDAVVEGETTALTKVEVEEIGNLVEDDEWLGLTTELAIVARVAIRESLKKSVREFTGNDDYKVGDLSKEADARIKASVAELRGKDEYELGDLSIALDGIVKEEVCKMTDEFGDLSVELDTRVKGAVADFCGKETYEVGDLSREIASRVTTRVSEFTGKGAYQFGDISREIDRRRVEWIQDVTGKAVEDYEFGDITKKAVSSFTGKDEYEFGDITKRVGQMLFGNKQVPKKKKQDE